MKRREYFFVCEENKNNDFFSTIRCLCVSPRHRSAIFFRIFTERKLRTLFCVSRNTRIRILCIYILIWMKIAHPCFAADSDLKLNVLRIKVISRGRNYCIRRVSSVYSVSFNANFIMFIYVYIYIYIYIYICMYVCKGCQSIKIFNRMIVMS